MTRRILLLIGLLATAGFFVFASSGCSHRDPADSSIPWGRPATWEDRVPGFDY